MHPSLVKCRKNIILCLHMSVMTLNANLNINSIRERVKKVIVADMTVKGGGGGVNPLSATK